MKLEMLKMRIGNTGSVFFSTLENGQTSLWKSELMPIWKSLKWPLVKITEIFLGSNVTVRHFQNFRCDLNMLAHIKRKQKHLFRLISQS